MIVNIFVGGMQKNWWQVKVMASCRNSRHEAITWTFHESISWAIVEQVPWHHMTPHDVTMDVPPELPICPVFKWRTIIDVLLQIINIAIQNTSVFLR